VANDQGCHQTAQRLDAANLRAILPFVDRRFLPSSGAKTKIVYCKDASRRGDFPDTHFDFLGFQSRARKIAWLGASSRRVSSAR